MCCQCLHSTAGAVLLAAPFWMLVPGGGAANKTPRLYRVIVPVGDIEQAANYYTRLLEVEGRRVSPGRHYFDCGGIILALFNPRSDGDPSDVKPLPDYVYFAVDDLEAIFHRAEEIGGLSPGTGAGNLPMGRIETRPWGEQSFYMREPFGNPLCFVDEKTVFTGLQDSP